MKIHAVLLYYKGNVEEVNQNIKCFIKHVDGLTIWLNSKISEEQKEQLIQGLPDYKIQFDGNGNNIGIAAAFNHVLEDLTDEIDYLLTMDQDSKWINFGKYKETVSANQKNDIFAFGPRVVVGEERMDAEVETITEVDHVINSGALIRCRVLKEIGGYCKDLFVDGVDEEVCFRAAEYGYKSIRVNSGCLYQRFGEAKKGRILWHTTRLPCYSARRKYEIAKSHIMILKKYKLPNKKRFSMLLGYVIKPLLDTILFENDKKEKLSGIFRGVHEGMHK